MELSIIAKVEKELVNRGFNVKTGTLLKNNAEAAYISIVPEGGAAPVIYEDYLKCLEKEGKTIEEIADAVLKIVYNNPFDVDFIIEIIHNREEFLSHLMLEVCNMEWNKDLLTAIPHRQVEGTDLAVFAVLDINRQYKAKVTNEMIASNGTTADEIIEAAMKNSQGSYSITGLDELFGYQGEPISEFETVYVITTEHGTYGAAAIAYEELLKGACRMLESESIYIIPSSVHELLIVSAKMIEDTRGVIDMISDINSHAVEVKDRLSNNLYRYDSSGLSIQAAEGCE